jgi:N-acetylmuramoyl-L-alanine amidase
MSNAADEEKLLDPIFRQQMAEKILQGILDYISFMFDKPAH